MEMMRHQLFLFDSLCIELVFSNQIEIEAETLDLFASSQSYQYSLMMLTFEIALLAFSLNCLAVCMKVLVRTSRFIGSLVILEKGTFCCEKAAKQERGKPLVLSVCDFT